MPEIGDDRTADAERIGANADVEKSAWEATLSDMKAIAADLEAEGWTTLAVAAGDTAPENPDSGASDRFGLSHVIPGNDAEEFVRLFEAGGFPRYEVHRAEASSRVFLVTTLLDPDRKVAILVAGTFERRHATGCIRAAKEAGKMYTHVQKLDGTHLGSFEHDDYEKFFPEADRIEG
ncbi:DUF7529 family protein [Halegenticoccus tardaugens]|uniref:DUF7529 family protein n=1 Tax=Halegenticoccus tardaugens TaxID=2071624 RepID=UPI00100A2DF6|nr:hypothetical protein [Halegenticoccus tardaugens]